MYRDNISLTPIPPFPGDGSGDDARHFCARMLAALLPCLHPSPAGEADYHFSQCFEAFHDHLCLRSLLFFPFFPDFMETK